MTQDCDESDVVILDVVGGKPLSEGGTGCKEVRLDVEVTSSQAMDVRLTTKRVGCCWPTGTNASAAGLSSDVNGSFGCGGVVNDVAHVVLVNSIQGATVGAESLLF